MAVQRCTDATTAQRGAIDSVLAVALGAVVRAAQHLAVLSRAVSARAPRRNVIGVHLVVVVDSRPVRVVAPLPPIAQSEQLYV